MRSSSDVKKNDRKKRPQNEETTYKFSANLLRHDFLVQFSRQIYVKFTTYFLLR